MPTRRELANAIRALAMDAVQKANSGHPGAPMGMADIAEVLYNDYMKHNPDNPKWVDRDRFVMSNGHGSMLPYSLLHLTGYDLDIDDLKNTSSERLYKAEWHLLKDNPPSSRRRPGSRTAGGGYFPGFRPAPE